MTFNLSSNITIEQFSTKTISILTTKHKHSNFIIILICIVDRIKLPPIIIFKLKKVLRKEFSDNVIIYINSKS